MTVGDLRKQLEGINDDVRVDIIVNAVCPEDDKYDKEFDSFEVMRTDVANDEGYCELLVFNDRVANWEEHALLTLYEYVRDNDIDCTNDLIELFVTDYWGNLASDEENLKDFKQFIDEYYEYS